MRQEREDHSSGCQASHHCGQLRLNPQGGGDSENNCEARTSSSSRPQGKGAGQSALSSYESLAEGCSWVVVVPAEQVARAALRLRDAGAGSWGLGLCAMTWEG